jgi:Ca-activated chloride channel family protein
MRSGVRSWFSARIFGPSLGLILAGCAWLALSGGSGRAQTARASIQPDISSKPAGLEPPDPSYRVTSDLVLIPVTVVDGRHGCVSGLAKEHFKLFEDKVEQIISHFNSEDSPVSVGIVFDASGSMEDKVRESREAVKKVLSTANPDDEFFLVQFNDRVDLVVGLTNQAEELQNRLMWIHPKGGTALLDAIYFSIGQFTKARNPRKALIIISDGGDNSSRFTLSEVKNAVREADVQIYAVGIVEPIAARSRTMEEAAGPALLHNIADQSGGRMFEIGDVSQLPDVASKISEELRNQYMLGYVPANPKHDGKYHKVQVKLVPPKGAPKMRAAWRHGYYAPVE